MEINARILYKSRYDLAMAVNGHEMYSALQEMDNYLRSKLKHCDLNDFEYGAYGDCRRQLLNLAGDYLWEPEQLTIKHKRRPISRLWNRILAWWKAVVAPKKEW